MGSFHSKDSKPLVMRQVGLIWSDGACGCPHAGAVTPGQPNWAALSPMLDAQLPGEGGFHCYFSTHGIVFLHTQRGIWAPGLV